MIEEKHLAEMEQYAQKHHVPIIARESLIWLQDFLATKQVFTILEVGAAIGYSSLALSAMTGAKVVAVERDAQRYAKAREHLMLYDQQQQVELHFNDANSEEFFEVVKQHAPYDVLFIDATKRQNQAFFEKFAPFVNQGGYIITDNIAFHGLATTAADLQHVHRRIRPMIRAIQAYKEWLLAQEAYETTFIDVGDMLAVTKKLDTISGTATSSVY